MTQQYQPNLGHLCDDTAKRDAVHIAVAPTVAPCDLLPGQHVDATGLPDKSRAVGIVDPYHVGGIGKGQRFWLFLYPGTVTSLRHDWEHPAFVAPATAKVVPVETPVAPSDDDEDDDDWRCAC